MVFRDEDAAYYQFPLFPHLEAEYVLGAARKRAGAVQHLRLELSRSEALQSFIESCRTTTFSTSRGVHSRRVSAYAIQCDIDSIVA